MCKVISILLGLVLNVPRKSCILHTHMYIYILANKGIKYICNNIHRENLIVANSFHYTKNY